MMPILLPEDLKDVLQQQFDRLSELGKQVISLVGEGKPAGSIAQNYLKMICN
jgi:hypothetical protein